MNEAIRIAITYEKGGVGKTTTAVNIAAEFAKRGYKTLLLDLDFQSYASTYFGLPYQSTINDIFVNKENPTNVIISTKYQNLYLLPANKDFESIEKYLIEQEIRGTKQEYLLKNLLADADNDYQYIIIDCPPNGGYIKENALVYADYLILPTIPDDNALPGLAVVADKVLQVKRSSNPRLEIMGLLITMYERTSLKKAYTEALQQQSLLPCFNTIIRKNAALAEARNNQKPICQYRRSSNGCKDYEALVTEILTITGGKI